MTLAAVLPTEASTDGAGDAATAAVTAGTEGTAVVTVGTEGAEGSEGAAAVAGELTAAVTAGTSAAAWPATARKATVVTTAHATLPRARALRGLVHLRLDIPKRLLPKDRQVYTSRRKSEHGGIDRLGSPKMLDSALGRRATRQPHRARALERARAAQPDKPNRIGRRGRVAQ